MKKKFKIHNLYGSNLINNFTKYYANTFDDYINHNFNWIADHVCVINKVKSAAFIVISNDLMKLTTKEVNKITKDHQVIAWVNFSHTLDNKQHVY